MSEEQPTLVSADRPTGRLHLGHWLGSLESRVRLQQEFRCFFLVADLHYLTTHATRSSMIETNTIEMVTDWLSVGIDPRRATFVVQSEVPQIAELATILSMLCPVPRAERIPALKEKLRELGTGESPSLGLLGYPVLMAADILIFHGARVPIGEDQLSHLELVRELARRFNRTFGDFFVEPEAVLSRVPRLVGTDGRAKMSKSLDNAIYLSDDPSTVARRVRAMYTDPRRVHSDVPGIVEGNPVFDYHDAFNPDSLEVADLKARYRAGKVGDVEVKERLTLALNRFLDPIRARRRVFEADRDGIRDLLRDGTRRARMLADATLRQVRRRIGTLVLNVDGERS